ncbi:uncharacterized protein LOC144437296 [Glandiceps talaboti]
MAHVRLGLEFGEKKKLSSRAVRKVDHAQKKIYESYQPIFAAVFNAPEPSSFFPTAVFNIPKPTSLFLTAVFNIPKPTNLFLTAVFNIPKPTSLFLTAVFNIPEPTSLVLTAVFKTPVLTSTEYTVDFDIKEVEAENSDMVEKSDDESAVESAAEISNTVERSDDEPAVETAAEITHTVEKSDDEPAVEAAAEISHSVEKSDDEAAVEAAAEISHSVEKSDDEAAVEAAAEISHSVEKSDDEAAVESAAEITHTVEKSDDEAAVEAAAEISHSVEKSDDEAAVESAAEITNTVGRSDDEAAAESAATHSSISSHHSHSYSDNVFESSKSDDGDIGSASCTDDKLDFLEPSQTDNTLANISSVTYEVNSAVDVDTQKDDDTLADISVTLDRNGSVDSDIEKDDITMEDIASVTLDMISTVDTDTEKADNTTGNMSSVSVDKISSVDSDTEKDDNTTENVSSDTLNMISTADTEKDLSEDIADSDFCHLGEVEPLDCEKTGHSSSEETSISFYRIELGVKSGECQSHPSESMTEATLQDVDKVSEKGKECSAELCSDVDDVLTGKPQTDPFQSENFDDSRVEVVREVDEQTEDETADSGLGSVEVVSMTRQDAVDDTVTEVSSSTQPVEEENVTVLIVGEDVDQEHDSNERRLFFDAVSSEGDVVEIAIVSSECDIDMTYTQPACSGDVIETQQESFEGDVVETQQEHSEVDVTETSSVADKIETLLASSEDDATETQPVTSEVDTVETSAEVVAISRLDEQSKGDTFDENNSGTNKAQDTVTDSEMLDAEQLATIFQSTMLFHLEAVDTDTALPTVQEPADESNNAVFIAKLPPPPLPSSPPPSLSEEQNSRSTSVKTPLKQNEAGTYTVLYINEDDIRLPSGGKDCHSERVSKSDWSRNALTSHNKRNEKISKVTTPTDEKDIMAFLRSGVQTSSDQSIDITSPQEVKESNNNHYKENRNMKVPNHEMSESHLLSKHESDMPERKHSSKTKDTDICEITAGQQLLLPSISIEDDEVFMSNADDDNVASQDNKLHLNFVSRTTVRLSSSGSSPSTPTGDQGWFFTENVKSRDAKDDTDKVKLHTDATSHDNLHKVSQETKSKKVQDDKEVTKLTVNKNDISSQNSKRELQADSSGIGADISLSKEPVMVSSGDVTGNQHHLSDEPRSSLSSMRGVRLRSSTSEQLFSGESEESNETDDSIPYVVTEGEPMREDHRKERRRKTMKYATEILGGSRDHEQRTEDTKGLPKKLLVAVEAEVSDRIREHCYTVDLKLPVILHETVSVFITPKVKLIKVLITEMKKNIRCMTEACEEFVNIGETRVMKNYYEDDMINLAHQVDVEDVKEVIDFNSCVVHERPTVKVTDKPVLEEASRTYCKILQAASIPEPKETNKGRHRKTATEKGNTDAEILPAVTQRETKCQVSEKSKDEIPETKRTSRTPKKWEEDEEEDIMSFLSCGFSGSRRRNRARIQEEDDDVMNFLSQGFVESVPEPVVEEKPQSKVPHEEEKRQPEVIEEKGDRIRDEICDETAAISEDAVEEEPEHSFLQRQAVTDEQQIDGDDGDGYKTDYDSSSSCFDYDGGETDTSFMETDSEAAFADDEEDDVMAFLSSGFSASRRKRQYYRAPQPDDDEDIFRLLAGGVTDAAPTVRISVPDDRESRVERREARLPSVEEPAGVCARVDAHEDDEDTLKATSSEESDTTLEEEDHEYFEREDEDDDDDLTLGEASRRPLKLEFREEGYDESDEIVEVPDDVEVVLDRRLDTIPEVDVEEEEDTRVCLSEADTAYGSAIDSVGSSSTDEDEDIQKVTETGIDNRVSDAKLAACELQEEEVEVEEEEEEEEEEDVMQFLARGYSPRSRIRQQRWAEEEDSDDIMKLLCQGFNESASEESIVAAEELSERARSPELVITQEEVKEYFRAQAEMTTETETESELETESEVEMRESEESESEELEEYEEDDEEEYEQEYDEDDYLMMLLGQGVSTRRPKKLKARRPVKEEPSARVELPTISVRPSVTEEVKVEEDSEEEDEELEKLEIIEEGDIPESEDVFLPDVYRRDIKDSKTRSRTYIEEDDYVPRTESRQRYVEEPEDEDFIMALLSGGDRSLSESLTSVSGLSSSEAEDRVIYEEEVVKPVWIEPRYLETDYESESVSELESVDDDEEEEAEIRLHLSEEVQEVKPAWIELKCHDTGYEYESDSDLESLADETEAEFRLHLSEEVHDAELLSFTVFVVKSVTLCVDVEDEENIVEFMETNIIPVGGQRDMLPIIEPEELVVQLASKLVERYTVQESKVVSRVTDENKMSESEANAAPMELGWTEVTNKIEETAELLDEMVYKDTRKRRGVVASKQDASRDLSTVTSSMKDRVPELGSSKATSPCSEFLLTLSALSDFLLLVGVFMSAFSVGVCLGNCLRGPPSSLSPTGTGQLISSSPAALSAVEGISLLACSV